MTIQRSSNNAAAAKSLSLQELKDFLATLEPQIKPDVLLAQDTRFGIIDEYLFSKISPDKNGVYSNVKLISKSFDNMKDFIGNFSISTGQVAIAYRPVNDKYHWLLIRKLNMNPENIEKYKLLF